MKKGATFLLVTFMTICLWHKAELRQRQSPLTKDRPVSSVQKPKICPSNCLSYKASKIRVCWTNCRKYNSDVNICKRCNTYRDVIIQQCCPNQPKPKIQCPTNCAVYKANQRRTCWLSCRKYSRDPKTCTRCNSYTNTITRECCPDEKPVTRCPSNCQSYKASKRRTCLDNCRKYSRDAKTCSKCNTYVDSTIQRCCPDIKEEIGVSCPENCFRYKLNKRFECYESCNNKNTYVNALVSAHGKQKRAHGKQISVHGNEKCRHCKSLSDPTIERCCPDLVTTEVVTSNKQCGYLGQCRTEAFSNDFCCMLFACQRECRQ